MADSLDEKTKQALDTLFQAWLALNGIVNKKGILYRADNQGAILCNDKETPLRIAPDFFNRLMSDPLQGFEAFVAKRGIHVKANQRAFPVKKK